MADPESRRRFLGTLGGAASATLAGCGELFGSDGDIRIENWGSTDHSVTVVFDRGESFDTEEWTVTVDGGATRTIDGAYTESDYQYAFYLHISVDGEYRTTTHHTWERTTEIVVRDGEVYAADETDRRLDFTPAEPPPGGLPTEQRAATPTETRTEVPGSR